nr:hypothetical protein StreXyl84_62330 [Streptomyces sp. Xyl84]
MDAMVATEDGETVTEPRADANALVLFPRAYRRSGPPVLRGATRVAVVIPASAGHRRLVVHA